tara:strand:+ start:131 stop:367 length:237 start_codon:yes stop_codon:yes gene_type:complete
MTDTNGAELRAFIERHERLESEKKDISEGQAEIMAEAKGRGYSVPALRKVLALRKMDKDDRDELEAHVEMYETAMGSN